MQCLFHPQHTLLKCEVCAVESEWRDDRGDPAGGRAHYYCVACGKEKCWEGYRLGPKPLPTARPAGFWKYLDPRGY